MAHVACFMTANFGDVFAESKCVGCAKPWKSGDRMNAMQYEDGSSAGWHCDDCLKTCLERGEQALPRWK